MPTEHVMVFQTRLLHEIGYFQGLRTDISKFYDHIILDKNYYFIPRDSAEADPNYKQVIPYILLHHNDSFFSYCRGKRMSETRLHDQFSIGLGGHIKMEDAALFGTYEFGLKRELLEEVNIQSPYTEHFCGVINDDSNEVGKVHFGFVYILNLENNKVTKKEQSVTKSGFLKTETLTKNIDNYENWSKLCIENIELLTSNIRKQTHS